MRAAPDGGLSADGRFVAEAAGDREEEDHRRPAEGPAEPALPGDEPREAVPPVPTATFPRERTDQGDVFRQFMEQVLQQQKDFMDRMEKRIANLSSISASPERRSTPPTASFVPEGTGMPPQAAPAGGFSYSDPSAESGTRTVHHHIGTPQHEHPAAPITTTWARIGQTPVFDGGFGPEGVEPPFRDMRSRNGPDREISERS